jgi:hypothetical protein
MPGRRGRARRRRICVEWESALIAEVFNFRLCHLGWNIRNILNGALASVKAIQRRGCTLFRDAGRVRIIHREEGVFTQMWKRL